MWNPFNSLLGAVRITGAVLVMVLGAVLIFFTTLIPFKVQGARASLWVVVYCARLFNLMFNVRVNCGSAPAIRQHHGFIFMNHLSFLEPLAVLSTTPVRFLAAAEVRRRPVSGWMAEQIGTVFVKRDDKESRAAARDSIAKVITRSQYPPVVVFPEGRLGMGDRVNPFFPGIFDTARQYEVPYLLCAVQFNRPEVAIWRGAMGEQLGAAVWRLAKSRGRIYVDIFPVGHVEPTPDDDPKQLARAARLAIAQKLDLLERVPR
ncbi:MAG: 1-acyl-sn-glycerol-3-phosphate acyltransferase [Caldilineaceae bacterium]|nr:1-acyl-sn-glycerol-3-phosphate acyltransferase [Caldilineaceae bacterium]MCB9159092.1 1-acyl-sn-glycerol-3-phosphate acyltransferase [Caldilineaceae bacterium]